MIAWWVCVLLCMGSGIAGLLIASLNVARRRADDAAERMWRGKRMWRGE